MRCAKSSITSASVFCRLNENATAAKYIEYTTRLASICLFLIFDKRESMDMVKKEKAILRDRQKWERKSVCSCVRCFLSTEPIIRVLQAKTTSAAAATCIVGGRNFIYSLLFFLIFLELENQWNSTEFQYNHFYPQFTRVVSVIFSSVLLTFRCVCPLFSPPIRHRQSTLSLSTLLIVVINPNKDKKASL